MERDFFRNPLTKSMIDKKIIFLFARNIWLTGFLSILIAIVFAIYVWSEKQIDYANDLRHDSLLLANELRQSSEDLTRLAQIYVVTGNPIHKTYYQDILDIRDGKKPRPEKYYKQYWTFLIADRKIFTSDSTVSISLLDLMQQKNFTKVEFQKFEEAKNKSDQLTITELEAMNLINPSLPHLEANRSKALHFLYDDKYFQAKAEIMRSISDFYEMVDTRTLETVRINEKHALYLRQVFILFGLGLFFMLWQIYLSLQKANNELEDAIAERTRELRVVNEQLQIDIIKIKRGEEKINQLSMAVEQSPLSIVITDTTGSIQYVNPKFVELTGYSFEEAIGKNPRILKSGRVPDEVYKQLWQKINDAEEWRGEFYNLKKNGELYWESALISPILNSDNKVTHFIAIKENITERRLTEKALIDLKFALDEHAIVSITDKNGKIINVNNNVCKISKYSREELIGKDHRILNSGYHSKEFMKNFWETIKNKQVWKGDFKNRAKDGSFYWVNSTIVPFLGLDGNPIQYISIRTDITESKATELALIQAKEQAEAASHAKSDFLANMSHEIRTPLNGVIGFTDLLIKTNLDEKQSLYMNTVYQSANSLLDLINDILDFSKIEAGKLELHVDKVDLPELIAQTIEIVKFSKKDKPINLLISLPRNLHRYIWVDAIRIRQILINLMGNALKFTKIGEIEIKVEILKSDEAVQTSFRFSVRDTGIGISKENQEKIFEAFSQEDSSITRNYGGTGLGLTISNKLLALMGTRLELESEVGKGSIFYFTLRAKSEMGEMNDLEQEDIVLPLDRSGNNLNSPLENESVFSIHIIEDNPVNMLLAKTILSQLLPNSLIIEANNGIQAIEIFKKGRPDIIFMDVQMPEMNGYDATKEIRKLETNNRTPIIALTAGSIKGEEEKCVEAGMDDYIPKPVARNSIQKVIYKWLIRNNDEKLKESKDDETNAKIHFDMKQLKARMGDDEDLLKKILSLAKKNLGNYIAEPYKHLQAKNLKGITDSAHKLKGTASSLCFGLLTQLATKLEMTENFEGNAVSDLLKEIEEEINYLQKYIL